MSTWMIVEDDLDLRDLLINMFALWGIEAMAFVDGEDAIKWIDSVDSGQFTGELPELAILDIHLLGMINGVMIGQRLRSSKHLKNTTIVITIAYQLTPAEEEIAINESGADSLLYKPFRRFKDFQIQLENIIAAKQLILRINDRINLQNKSKKREPQSTHIMIVEDVAPLRSDMAEMLKIEGYSVTDLENGLLALEWIKDKDKPNPDLIISDIMMPKLDGYGVLQYIRSVPKLNHIPFIFLTAKSERSQVRKGMSLGADDYLSKPFENEELLDAVQARLQAEPLNKQKFYKKSGAITKNAKIIIIPVNLSKTLIPQLDKLIEQLSMSDNNVKISDLYWYLSDIASFDPNCIILIGESHLLLDSLRNFELSKYLPIIIFSQFSLGIEESFRLIDLGVDELCIPNTAIADYYINNTIKQYSQPSLINSIVAWNILVFSTDKLFTTALKDYFEYRYNVVIWVSDSTENLIQLVENNLVDILCIDASENVEFTLGGDLITRLQLVDSEINILLFCEPKHVKQFLNMDPRVRGVLSKPLETSQVDILIRKLQRSNLNTKSTNKIWSEYSIRISELEYENFIRYNAPNLAGMIHEISITHSGFFHDLINIFTGLATQVDRTDNELYKREMQLHLKLASLLLQIIADLRFKGSWTPKKYPNCKDLIEIVVVDAVKLISLLRPSTRFEFKNHLSIRSIFGVDLKQLVQLVFCLCVSITDQVNASKIQIIASNTKSQTLNLTFNAYNKWRKPYSLQKLDLTQQILNRMNYDVFALSAYKILQRHGGNTRAKNKQLVLSLPYKRENDQVLRVQIAELAVKEISLQAENERFKPFAEIETLQTLTAPIAADLIAHLRHLLIKAKSIQSDDRITAKIHHSILLARDFLITSTDFEPELSAVDVAKLFHQLFLLRGDFFADCKVSSPYIEVDIPAIQGDEMGLLQMLINLTTNAVEAMSDEDGVIENAKLMLAAKRHPNGVELIISDTGSGIPVEHIDKIFNLFYTTKKGHERGVGLYIVKSVAEKLGGHIEIETIPNVGTTFRIILPAAM